MLALFDVSEHNSININYSVVFKKHQGNINPLYIYTQASNMTF